MGVETADKLAKEREGCIGGIVRSTFEREDHPAFDRK